MRIIAGHLKGRKLIDSTSKNKVRPTTDRNREALFSILTSSKTLSNTGFEIKGSNILDACCGTGAVAIEGISRGAKSATLIEISPENLILAKNNAKSFNIENSCKFLLCDIKKNLPKCDDIFDLVFIDPPYLEDYSNIIKSLKREGWIDKKSLIVIEAPSSQEASINNIDFLDCYDSRKYGISKFIFCKVI